MRIDDERIGVEQHRVAVGCGAGCRLGRNDGPGPRAVLNQRSDAVRFADFLSKQPRENVRGAAGRKRHHELDHPARLRLRCHAQQGAQRNCAHQSIEHSNPA
jgi:hypothetical protein